HPGVEEDALRGRGLAGIDVGDDAEVAVALYGSLAGHFGKLSKRCGMNTRAGGMEGLEPVMRERLVRVGHAVDLFALAHGAATAPGLLDELAREARVLRLLAALAGGLPDPAHGEGGAAHRAHLDRDLVVRAADAAALHLDHGLHVAHGLGEHAERVLPRLLGNL